MRCARLVVTSAAWLALWTPASVATAQPLPELHYLSASWTEKDGLPGSGLWAIEQDHDGYVWLGTNAGLVRFDGVRFVHWNLIQEGLPNSAATSLKSAANGDLWVGFGGTGGVGRLRDGRFDYFRTVGDRPIGTVSTIVEDHGGRVWFGGSAGTVTHASDQWERVNGALDGAVYSLVKGADGELIAATGDGIVRIPESGASLLLHPMRHGARGVARDLQGRVWAAAIDNPLVQVLPHVTAPRAPARGDPPGADDLLVDHHGNIWLGTAGTGLWIVPADTDAPRTLRRMDPALISHQAVRALMEDREGNVWVGTQHGLTRLSPAKLAWAPRALPADDQPIRAVLSAGDGTVWASGRETVYRFSGAQDRVLARHGMPDGITALHAGRDGALWIGAPGGRLSRILQGRTTSFALPEPAGDVAAIASDSSGAVWASDLVSGVHRLNGSRFERMDLRDDVEREPAISMYLDRRGRLWIGFNDGVLAMYDAGRVQDFRDLAREQDVAVARVYSMYEDSRGTFWIGTNTGLRVLKDNRLLPIELDYTRIGSYVVAVTEDGAGHLWIGCSQGLVRISRDAAALALAQPDFPVEHVMYDTSDGMPGRPAWLQGSPSVAQTPGTLWFVTSNGLAAVDPDQWNVDRVAPPVRIETVTADGRELRLADASELGPKTARLQIDFTALSFAAPQKVRFRYRLDGFDRDWIDAGTRRQAFYTNLPPGRYTFAVTAGFDGEWNQAPARWDFSVRPAYYQTTWFAAGTVLAGALVVIGALRHRSQRARERFRLILAERARVSREIHDTLLQSLIGVTLQFDALESELGPDERVRGSFQALRGQLKQSIRDARHSIRNLRSPVPKLDLTTALQKIANDVAAARGVMATVDLQGTPRPLPAEKEEELLRIAQEALTNAVRHAKATSVWVELRYGTDDVRLTVTDNGRGFDPHVAEFNAHDHWGLASMQERAEQIAAEFSLSTQPGEGTSIRICLRSPSVKEAGVPA